jgi:uncharacterized glyoxalase superfamily protein PhnB
VPYVHDECSVPPTLRQQRDSHGLAESNLESKHEVDKLYHRWRAAGAKILAEPEDKPWHLREFRVADLDGNQLRVFYDFSSELQQDRA